MGVNDLLDLDQFGWRLRVLMTMGDIRVCELSAATGLDSGLLGRIRTERRKLVSEDLQARNRMILLAIEDMRPGLLDMLRAAEIVGRHVKALPTKK